MGVLLADLREAYYQNEREQGAEQTIFNNQPSGGGSMYSTTQRKIDGLI
jgi:hypothetical protein